MPSQGICGCSWDSTGQRFWSGVEGEKRGVNDKKRGTGKDKKALMMMSCADGED